jgi:CsoR family transcriptional regulator, copper-sensing transcriptional repressor
MRSARWDREVGTEELHARLSRIEGQVRGIGRMIDQDRSCLEVATQIQAIHAALDQVGLALLARRMWHRLEREPGTAPELVAEVMDPVARLLRRG